MALNFSHRPIFPSHISEDNIVSPMRISNGYFIEGIPEKNGDGFVKPRHYNRDIGDCFDYGRDRADRSGSQDPVPTDILDILPSDPFGMDISSTFTAITGWLEDLEVDYGGYGMDDVGASDADYELFAGLNFIWNKAMEFNALPGNATFGDKFNIMGGFDVCSGEKGLRDAFYHGVSNSVCNVEGILCSGFEHASVSQPLGVLLEGSGSFSDGDARAPHAAFSFALSYLGVQDLLSVERVCKSLHSTVRNDPLLWMSIHIDQPLNEKITDDVLVQLTSRAQGNLQCLSLVDCPRITDDGLRRVLGNNLRLTKLCVPGCTRLNIEGVVQMVKTFKDVGTQGIKHLRIGGLYGVMQGHYEELNFLLSVGSHMQQNAPKPHFYHRGNIYLSCDDDRAIDIEMCPRCQSFRLVYDCPAEGCQGKGCATQICRACILCIQRCVHCGRCINDGEYEETFCLELLCSDCWKILLKQQEMQDKSVGTYRSAIVQGPSYNS